MEKIQQALDELEKINKAYEQSTDSIQNLKKEMSEAKVCVPIIGKFSTGKSALVNTILGYSRNILKEDITPETAIPAEIVYSEDEDKITVIKNDGSQTYMAVEDYRNYQADANTVKCARIQLRNTRFLQQIPDVVIVDMPGFESGIEIHNKAIDNYLPQSLAYIIAFPADDMIVRKSVGDILKELWVNDMPLGIVITKYDKRNEEEFDIAFENLKENLKRYIGENAAVKFCRTSSFTGDAEELEEFLLDIQEQSKNILSKKYAKAARYEFECTEKYLKTLSENNMLQESEIESKKDRLNKTLRSLNSELKKEKEKFEDELSDCIAEIRGDIQQALEAKETDLVMIIMQKGTSNKDIEAYLNNVIRIAVTESMHKKIMPQVNRYVHRVEKYVNTDAINVEEALFDVDVKSMNVKLSSKIVANVTGVILGLFNAMLGLFVGMAIKKIQEQKYKEAKEQIRMQLRAQVFPQIVDSVYKQIENEVNKQIDQVNDSIEQKIEQQRVTLEKALEDAKKLQLEEQHRQEEKMKNIQADIERIGELKNGL